jgi:hypothetical protein
MLRLSHLDDTYVVITADKAPNNIVFECKSHSIDCFIKEFGNPTNTPTTLMKAEILASQVCVVFL